MIERARRIADEVLFPDAQAVDRSVVPRSHLDVLADAGLFSFAGVDSSEARRVMATIAGGCGATFFVWVQHHGVVRTVAASRNDGLTSELLEPMRSGGIVAGTAFAHVRRTGTPAITARPDGDGWRLDGTAPWATSWGIADRFCIAAETDDGRLVWSMVPGHETDGITASDLALPVFAATGTVVLHFDGCRIEPDSIVSTVDVSAWRRSDRRRASLGSPAVLGVSDRAIRLLRDAGDDGASRAADSLAVELDEAWERDDRLGAALSDPLLDESGDAENRAIAAASAHRAACLDLGRRTTTALLAAVGGRGMDLGHPAQRLMREAGFYVIQAQTADGREATLAGGRGATVR